MYGIVKVYLTERNGVIKSQSNVIKAIKVTAFLKKKKKKKKKKKT